MAEQSKGAFFDQEQVDKWDARELGQALRPVLARIGKLSRTGGNVDQIRSQLEGDPDALIGLDHLKDAMRSTTR